MRKYYQEHPEKKALGNKSGLGLVWINDGSIEKKILKTEIMPANFIRGRVFRRRKA